MTRRSEFLLHGASPQIAWISETERDEKLSAMDGDEGVGEGQTFWPVTSAVTISSAASCMPKCVNRTRRSM
jgi:hypothetical protein